MIAHFSAKKDVNVHNNFPQKSKMDESGKTKMYRFTRKNKAFYYDFHSKS